MAMAAVVIVGWILDVRILKSFVPGLISMKINTALGFMVAGSGVFLLARERPDARHVAAGGGVRRRRLRPRVLILLEHAAGMDLGIDQALVRDARDDGNPGAPGRMAPATAFNFMLVGLALLCLASSAARGSRRRTGSAVVVVLCPRSSG